MLLAAFVGTATNIAVPVLEEEFAGVGLTKIAWVISAFNVAQVTFMLLGGRIADRIGRRRVFINGLAVFALGAALSGIAPTVDLIIAARIVQAIGVAMMLPASLAAVLPEFPAERHGSVVSLWSSMGVLGAASAPTVAAVLLEVSSWRVVFLIAIPIALVAIVAARKVMSPGLVAENPPPLDLLGAATGTASVGGVTFLIVQVRSWGLTDPRILVITAAAVLSGVVFIRSSLTHNEPLFDLQLLKIPSFRVVTMAGQSCRRQLLQPGFCIPYS